ncbi:YARHG domain-containing protein [Aquimarina litoralis]|uniref:YARHG domain-containing protein n=1 Tax=Aquimarina litoralis TaxID=584605 RepID=UPI001C56A7F7|nr:YARHG domain-containing protein [Aquimarina litoralis]MBW1297989.1 YARHG domain-containing protein [Aquimarina litoralis]
MRNIIFFLFALLICSCKKEVQKEKTEIVPIVENETTTETSVIDDKEEKTISKNDPSDYNHLLGTYVGSFQASKFSNTDVAPSYSNKINISIDKIDLDSIYGHSVVAGNKRPFKGNLDKTSLFARVLEPGDDKYDGVFEINFLPGQKEIKGIWIANNKNLSVVERKYTLIKKKYKYNAELNLDYDIEYDYNLALYKSQEEENGELEAISPQIVGKLNASTQELNNTNIENLNKGELEVLRNLIYARHGYSFKNRKMRYFFDSYVDWYIPVSTDIRNQLTDLEKKNIDLIKRYEQHAERYYDYFGR